MTTVEQNSFKAGLARIFALALLMTLQLSLPGIARADVVGIGGPGFSLTARDGYVLAADGGSIYSWGYSANGKMQLPGPTLIVDEGDLVTVTLDNALPVAAGNVSIVFPGQDVTASGGVPGSLTNEAPSGGSVTYTFTAGEPGTYQYHSGTQPDLQVEMGLYGALIVRPGGNPCPAGMNAAYNHAGACYDREYLYVLSEIDYDIHVAAELQVGGPGPVELPLGAYHSEYWFMNGRAGPDTMAADGDGALPSQPYGSLTRMHPGEKVLIRVVGAGRESHPFHHHGNHSRVLAVDGNLLLNGSGSLAGPKLFTLPSSPGATIDAIFEWTGEKLGWDMYGHAPGDGVPCTPDAEGFHNVSTADNYYEYCGDHEKPLPVTLPSLSNLAFGGFWGGSPYLGNLGSLPPGEGGLNPDAGFTFMWHSHTERELVNNDVFPGGMMTMLIVEAPWVQITPANP